jgi:hypothetical protein
MNICGITIGGLLRIVTLGIGKNQKRIKHKLKSTRKTRLLWDEAGLYIKKLLRYG